MGNTTKIIHSKLQLRTGTKEEWEASDDILYAGEPAIASRTNNVGKTEYFMKIGDGENTFSNLPNFRYYNIQVLDHAPEASETDENTITFVKYKG